jgi:hypothetical protein
MLRQIKKYLEASEDEKGSQSGPSGLSGHHTRTALPGGDNRRS